jgi:dihydrofolate reductase
VRGLKHEAGGDLTVMGSGELIHTLARAGLVDEYVLFVHPLVLGTGRRLFAEGTPPTSLRLVESSAAASGVVIARYETVGGPG